MLRSALLSRWGCHTRARRSTSGATCRWWPLRAPTVWSTSFAPCFNPADAKKEPRMRLVMRGGTVVDSEGMRRADVAVEGKTVSAVGDLIAGPDDHVIDCRGRHVLPGFVDTHSHADGLMED